MQNIEYSWYHQRLSLPAISLSLVFMAIFGIVPILPGTLVTILKPLFIATCLLFGGYGYYRMGYEKWQVVLLAYLVLIFIANYVTDPCWNDFLSMVLFALFYLFAGLRIWTTREIRCFFYVLAICCSVYSLIVLFSNNGLFQIGGNQHIKYLSVTMNRNNCAFAVAPGAVSSVFIFLFDKKMELMKRAFCIGAIVICSFTIIALSCRSAFLSAASGVFLIVWAYYGNNTGRRTQIGKRLLFIGFILVSAYVLMLVLSGTNSARLFDYQESGRDGLWKDAWSLIQRKPIIGGGFNYWSKSGQLMGTHNTFLSIMLISGYIGGAFLTMWILSMMRECLRFRNAIALAFAMEMVCHSISESGLDYYAYVPLILTSILLRYSEYINYDYRTIFE